MPSPSSAPCTPAPNRKFIIARTDNQSLPATVLAALDNLIMPNVIDQSTPYQSYSSALNTIPTADSPTQSKKRWSLFKSIIPFNASPGNSRPGEVTPPLGSEEANFSFDRSQSSRATPPKQSQPPPVPLYRPLSFRFSLEWHEKPLWPAEDRLLTAPRLPGLAMYVVGSISGVDASPRKPNSESMASARYAGRALAEWELIVAECDEYFHTRKEAGVPLTKLIETPLLNVESFKMAG